MPTKMSDTQADEYIQWLKTLPEAPRKSAISHPPHQLYRLTTTDHIVPIIAYSDDGTVTVAVLAQYNLLNMERKVFGVNVSVLEPCEAPGPEIPVGITMSEPEQLEYINKLRVQNGVKPADSLDELRGETDCVEKKL